MLTTGEWAESRLGHAFRDATLLETALTHRSAGRRNYERLEFVGDAVLNFVIAELLYRECPAADEGELSRRRAALVSGGTLAEVAAQLGLGARLRLGGGELKSGGFRRSSILADSLEALFGAVYLDGGVDAARSVIAALFGGRIGALPGASDLKDPKTRLQEHLQARGLPLPAYAVEELAGEPHAQSFVASCEVASLGLRALGEGSSRRRAEQVAAERLLVMLRPEEAVLP